MDNSMFDSLYKEALDESKKVVEKKDIVVCCDVLTGVINMAVSEASKYFKKKIGTLFVSAIGDRIGYYADDVDLEGNQLKTVIYNSGVAVSALVEKLENIMSNSTTNYI